MERIDWFIVGCLLLVCAGILAWAGYMVTRPI